MMFSTLVFALSLLVLKVAGQDDNNRLYSQICLDPDAKHVPGEFFRDARVSGSGDCRSVVSCSNGGLSYLRCPTGLHFDIEEQTCQWAGDVDNCDVSERNHTALPDLDESKCGGKNLSQPMFSCADGTCLPKTKLCDGKRDCDDGSDESACDANEANHARPCDVEKCRLPKCFCSPSGKEIPGGLKKDDVPQMVILTFDDAVNVGNQQTFEEIFNKGRKNANGCDIKASFFVSHKYSNYSMIHELHRRGHDISVHSISHNNEPSFWTRGSVDDWSKELLGHKFIIEEFAKIPSNEIPGARAPLLRVGGNSQYEVMKAGQFQYDSTMTALYQDVPYWPYTLDYSIPHKCHGNVQKCPTKSFPGLWSMVMNEFDGSGILNENERSPLTSSCAMVDSCNIQDAEQFYNALTVNFMRHYESNRAPLGIYMHAAWLIGHPEMFEALLHWLDQVTEDFPDTYVVSMSQAVDWMKNPTPLSSIANFGPWKKKCTEKEWPKSGCKKTKECLLKSAVHEPGEVHKLISCADYCPATYPWTNDFLGRSSLKP